MENTFGNYNFETTRDHFAFNNILLDETCALTIFRKLILKTIIRSRYPHYAY